ncbi:Ldh family oxidoreductase [Jiangella asiatica]|uniref:Ldh family oxidoreductase n=1 Tax=Jiangella asiatica TaxID=2530372 RepID=A0A4R5CP30_9ACTN|nr:Ldh family oxidoreductase [Jiangella asiatica]TDE00154.1 Ldh family oxidoreductase [Jiangella asiatica]
MTKSSAYMRGTAATAPPQRVPLDELRAHCSAVLRGAGLAHAAADLVADSLTDAEARGISSHGVTRTRIYAERLQAGMIDGAATPVVVREDTAGVHLDAGNAIGHVGASAGIDLAIEKAESGSVGAVGVANSNHCGTLAYFTRRAARAGLVAIAMSTAPTTMVYFGGKSRAVGTNPLSIAVPRRDGPPITVDMATSATARGKIILANQLGQDIPEGWAVDVDGRPTTDAAAALEGSVMPFGGPKGSGLAMMVDLLAGALVAGVSGEGIGDMYEDWTRPQRVGHLFITLNPDGWLGRSSLLAHVEDFAGRIHDLPPAEGFDQVLLPGEMEERAYERARTDGVTLSAAVFADLQNIADEVGAQHQVVGTTAD